VIAAGHLPAYDQAPHRLQTTARRAAWSASTTSPATSPPPQSGSPCTTFRRGRARGLVLDGPRPRAGRRPAPGHPPLPHRPAPPALLTATDQAIATAYARHHTTQLPTSELVRALHDAGIGDRSAHTLISLSPLLRPARPGVQQLRA